MIAKVKKQVKVTLHTIIDRDRDGFDDLLSEDVCGPTARLDGILWRIVDHTPTSVVLEVTGGGRA